MYYIFLILLLLRESKTIVRRNLENVFIFLQNCESGMFVYVTVKYNATKCIEGAKTKLSFFLAKRLN
jgi:hypothetical protein